MIGKKKKKIAVNEASESPVDKTAVVDDAQSGATAGAEESSRAEAGDIETLRKELAEAKDKFLRSKAETQNIQRRAAVERQEAVKYANASLIKNLLATLDDFERTLEQSKDVDIKTVLEGVRIVYDGFTKVLKDQRVEAIDPLGEHFDPRFHEAMLQQPSDQAPGTVIQVVQRGFVMDDRVLRPAKVIIAAQPAGGDGAAATSDGDSAPSTEGQNHADV